MPNVTADEIDPKAAPRRNESGNKLPHSKFGVPIYYRFGPADRRSAEKVQFKGRSQ